MKDPNPFAIPATPEMIDKDATENAEIMALFETNLNAWGYLKPEAVPTIIARLGGYRAGFARINTESAFRGDILLTVEEKRGLKLNTRRKYYKEFIDLFIQEKLEEIEPKSALRRMHLDAYYRVGLRRSLADIRNNSLGFTEVDIQPGPYPCPAVKQLARRHPIERVPLLPLEECTSGGCQCSYYPVLESSEFNARPKGRQSKKKPRYLLWLFLILGIFLLIKLFG